MTARPQTAQPAQVGLVVEGAAPAAPSVGSIAASPTGKAGGVQPPQAGHSSDAEGYHERRLAGALLVARLAVGRVAGPLLRDDAPLSERTTAFRERLRVFRESLAASMPPPVLRTSHWSRP